MSSRPTTRSLWGRETSCCSTGTGSCRGRSAGSMSRMWIARRSCSGRRRWLRPPPPASGTSRSSRGPRRPRAPQEPLARLGIRVPLFRSPGRPSRLDRCADRIRRRSGPALCPGAGGARAEAVPWEWASTLPDAGRRGSRWSEEPLEPLIAAFARVDSPTDPIVPRSVPPTVRAERRAAEGGESHDADR